LYVNGFEHNIDSSREGSIAFSAQVIVASGGEERISMLGDTSSFGGGGEASI
jgi:hypothetical protein